MPFDFLATTTTSSTTTTTTTLAPTTIMTAAPSISAYNFSMDFTITGQVPESGKNITGTLAIEATLVQGILNLALYFDGVKQVRLWKKCRYWSV